VFPSLPAPKGGGKVQQRPPEESIYLNEFHRELYRRAEMLASSPPKRSLEECIQEHSVEVNDLHDENVLVHTPNRSHQISEDNEDYQY
jgi:hypothetical protein